MARVLLGFVVGVAFTALAFMSFFGDSEEAPSEANLNLTSDTISDTPDAIASVDGASANVRETASEIVQNLSERDPAQESDILLLTLDMPIDAVEERFRDFSREDLDRVQEQAQRAQNSAFLAQREIRRRDAIERWANAPAPEQPIALPPEFGWLTDEPNSIHETLQREPYDPNWSPTAEAQIQGYFAQHPDITQKYGLPTINCRTTGCQMAFVAYGIDDPALAAELGWTNEGHVTLDFRSVTAAIDEQAWRDQFDFSALSVNVEDGTTTILWHLVLPTD